MNTRTPIRSTLHTAALTLLLSSGLLALPAPALAQTQEQGGLLRDSAGRTLYTFDKDANGASTCYSGCDATWPPFMAKEGAKASGPLTLHTREGGGQQWGWKGQPLYHFAADAQPGDANGDGKGGVWHVVKPSAKVSQAPAERPLTGY